MNGIRGKFLPCTDNTLRKVKFLICHFLWIPMKVPKFRGVHECHEYTLKRFLQVGSFYSLSEYFGWKTRDDLDSYK
jgi:hypothetical protein